MGSPRWAPSFGQPWSSAGSLWGWVVSRIQPGRTIRFFEQDEEMLVLTHSDELNRTYGEDSRFPFDHITNKNTSSPSLSEQDTPALRERPAPDLPGSSSTSWPGDGPSFKETRATVISTGPRTITITSTVSSADSLWLRNTSSYGKGERSSEMEEDTTGRQQGGEAETQGEDEQIQSDGCIV
ncbi:unnamed protein product [Pleuronectes platessa]|uniref:Uncharacterized protein n=1 Tax=Pleuronectes platessa TaxID=8262 RepID=A0A9N7U7F8_PLEPL|nr:unnamed protein product [Pleuronectes platessa]